MLRKPLVAAASVLASTVLAAQGPLLQLVGENAQDGFGVSLAFAGDVDGDGAADVIVGAPSNDAFAGFAGRAYVFHGPFSARRSAEGADAVISGTTFGDNLGIAVSAAGDVNADGIDDVLVGARGNDGAGIQAGRAYVFLGPVRGALRDVDADASISGRPFDEVGRAVAPAGDMNGDGVDDVVVGGPEAANAAGEAHVFYGPLSGALSVTSADATVTGVSFNELLGTSLVAADLDGDGNDDLAVGAPRPPLNGRDTGKVYVFFGPLSGQRSAANADATLSGEGLSDEFGSSLAAGDVDGDGATDLIVGAEQFFTAGAGKAYVFHGPLAAGQHAAAQADAILVGEREDDHFGKAVGTADLDGDGLDDVLVGADGYDAAGPGAGRAYAFFGPLSGTTAAARADLVFTGTELDELGSAVAGAADGDGNGLEEALIGAPAHPSSPSPGFAALVVPARAAVRPMSSCTTNPATLTVASGEPVPGSSVTLAMDGGQSSGAATVLLLAAVPAPGWPPCGTTLAGAGEVLVSPGPPLPAVVTGPAWTGSPVPLPLAVPSSSALLGASVFAQGAFADTGGAAGVPPLQLTGGVELRVGL